MKKTLTITTLTLLAGAVSVYSQGQVSMADLGGGDIGIQVFNLQSANNTTVSYLGVFGQEVIGNSGNTFSYNYSKTPGANPNATVSYKAGSALGAGYSVELLAGPTSDTSVSQLGETGTIITAWNTGSQSTGSGGMWFGGPNATVAGILPGGNAAVAIAAWNNEGGTVLTLAQAVAAGDPWGVSNLGLATDLGGGLIQPPVPTGLDSFSLATTVPEPSTIALGVMGASALLFRRRK
jgi:hypothetical protein